jgi:hypothetical protein
MSSASLSFTTVEAFAGQLLSGCPLHSAGNILHFSANTHLTSKNENENYRTAIKNQHPDTKLPSSRSESSTTGAGSHLSNSVSSSSGFFCEATTKIKKQYVMFTRKHTHHREPMENISIAKP